MPSLAGNVTQFAWDVAIGVLFNVCGVRQPIFRGSRAVELRAARMARAADGDLLPCGARRRSL